MKRKSNNTGSISYNKARKKYRAQFTSPITGKRIEKQFATQKEAEVWLAQQITAANTGMFVEPSKLTVLDWTAEYLETYSKPKVAPSTLALYVQTAEKLAPIADIPIQKLTPAMVQNFFNDMDATPNTKLKVYRLLKQMLKKAFVLGMIPRNIMDPVEAPQYRQGEIETFTKEELTSLLQSIRNSQYYAKYYPLFLLAMSSGARLNEILGLKIGDVHSDYIHIGNNLQRRSDNKRVDAQPKTEAGIRDIRLPKEVIAELQKAYRYKGCILGGYVFHTEKGNYIITSNVERTWKAVLKEAGLRHRHFHALRHTHATELLANGVPIIEVSRRLGHAKVSTTLDMYGHKIPGLDVQIADRISDMLQLAVN